MKYIDQEEQNMIESFEQALADDSVTPSSLGQREEYQTQWQDRVVNTQARRPVTLRLQHRDIQAFKIEAQKKGIPYQTLLSSVVHQYASGDLVQK